jgi:pyridoxamine-phosphate oxidase
MKMCIAGYPAKPSTILIFVCYGGMGNSFHSIRQEYSKSYLRDNDLDSNPLIQLESWLSEAVTSGCDEPTAMVVSTTGVNLRPSSRVVLLKELVEAGLTFFTNYDSRKGQQLQENPFASALFFWPLLERQVRVEGKVEKVSEAESDSYFDSRPEASRISALISPQSREIPNRLWLDSLVGTNTCVQPGVRPPNWGGYRLFPEYFEFWQGRESRLHDRIAYERQADGWRVFRLAP